MAGEVSDAAQQAARPVQCRGIRGATTVEVDTAEAILAATAELLAQLVEANQVDPRDVASAQFTVTPDLTAAFPARAARDLGWRQVPLLDAQEIPVPGSLARCVRVLVHWNTDKLQSEIRHVYLRGAAELRPDLVTKEGER
jgi:chorismate mutase